MTSDEPPDTIRTQARALIDGLKRAPFGKLDHDQHVIKGRAEQIVAMDQKAKTVDRRKKASRQSRRKNR